MAPPKVVFMGQKQVATECFRHLISLQERGVVDIVGVLSKKHVLDCEDSVLSLSRRHGVPLLDGLATFMALDAVDVVMSVQFDAILQPEHLEKARLLNVNLHMAPLPEYRGCNQFSHALLDGRDFFGTTLHVIDEKIDHGDILFERRFAIPDGCWVHDLYDLTVAESVRLFRDAAEHLMTGNYSRIPQCELEEQRGSSLHFRSSISQLKQVNPGEDAASIAARVRATSMPGFEPSFLFVDGHKLYLVPERYAAQPDRLLSGEKLNALNQQPQGPEKKKGVPFADLKAQYRRLQPQMDAAMAKVIADSAFIGGSYARRFEGDFAEFCGAGHCVGVGNGTDALFVALRALGIGPGHEVLVPAMTFVATSEAVTMAGARPVFVDVDPASGTMSVEDLRRKITPACRAVIPVHLYGHPADMVGIEAVAAENGLRVVQDAAQAHGATVEGRPLAEFGDCACYSFYPGKNLGAYGDAGAVVCNDGALAQHMRKLTNHGRKDKYDHDFEGVNSRLDGMQAAVLFVKLPYLPEWTAQRRAIAAVYDRELAGVDGLVLPPRLDWAGHVYHLYVVQSHDRDGLQKHLADHGIASGIHYPVALPFLEAYARCGHVPQDFPVAHAMQETVLSLPMYAELTEEQALLVCKAVRGFYAQQNESAICQKDVEHP